MEVISTEKLWEVNRNLDQFIWDYFRISTTMTGSVDIIENISFFCKIKGIEIEEEKSDFVGQEKRISTKTLCQIFYMLGDLKYEGEQYRKVIRPGELQGCQTLEDFVENINSWSSRCAHEARLSKKQEYKDKWKKEKAIKEKKRLMAEVEKIAWLDRVKIVKTKRKNSGFQVQLMAAGMI